MNQFYYRKGWTDGLPIFPPTEEAVAEMMKGTDLPPDHIVAKLIPRMGKATVKKIAVNAVMAGALPIHMPLLIAAVDALCGQENQIRYLRSEHGIVVSDVYHQRSGAKGRPHQLQFWSSQSGKHGQCRHRKGCRHDR